MIFRTDPHITRAKEHLVSGDTHRLRYACLELRLALERIAYQKLKLRLGNISGDEVSSWQPRRVMDTLMELVDPYLDRDAVLRMGRRPGGGDPATDTFQPVGTVKGINPKLLGKYWQKLGYFLHIDKPTKKGQSPNEPDPQTLSAFIEDVTSYVEEMTETAFDLHFCDKVTFKCLSCKQSIVRNRARLKEDMIVRCQNAQCDESYITHLDGEQFLFKPYRLSLVCSDCGETMKFVAKKLLDLPYDHSTRVRCSCGARHEVFWRLQYVAGTDPQEGKET
jgi:hypothetical protein